MARVAGFSGTVFRLQGGSLTEGEDAPFDKVVFNYSIVDGIRQGFLCPAFTVATDDKIDVSKLRVRQGDYTGESQDAQTIELLDSHIAQMKHYGRDRRAWLVFEASTKAAYAMLKRCNEWGVPTGLVLGETPAAERANTIAAFRAGRLKCLINIAALTTGFDVQEVDMLVFRRRTKSLGLFVQMCGRGLRTIGGNIESSIAAGKADSLVLDFAGLIDQHGALDFLRPKDTVARLVSCDNCGKRNAAAAARCWSCDEPMTKRCPACLEVVAKGVMDCPYCEHDMRVQPTGEPKKAQKLLETPSGAALISAYKPGVERSGGWLPVRRAWERDGAVEVATESGAYTLPGPLRGLASDVRWVRVADGAVAGALVPNGGSRTSVRQYGPDGGMLVVPMPTALERQN